DLESLAGIAQPLGRGNAAIVENQTRKRMRRHYLNALRDLQPWRAGVNNKRRDSLGAAFFPRACKDHIEVGNAAIGAPGCFSVEEVGVAFFPGHTAESRDIRSSVRLRDGKGGDSRSPGYTREVALLLLVRPEIGNGSRAQALHGKREVGETGVAGQRLAN